MSVQLLDKTRKIAKLLHNNSGYKIPVNEVCGRLGELIYSSVVIADGTGRIVGLHMNDNIPVIESFLGLTIGDELDEELNERFVSVLSTKENVNLSMMGFEREYYEHYDVLIIPIDISGERLGTLFAYRLKKQYDIDDIILGEYVSTIVAMEMLHDVYEAGLGDNQKEMVVKAAVRALSSSERLAASYVLKELAKTDGILVTSHVAGKYHITRSIIVNAIKKLNSAGVITSKSMGTKGTSIHIENEYIMEALDASII